MFTLSNAFFPYIGGPGLNVALDGGVVINNGSSTFIPAQTISVAANSTTFIFLNTSSIIIQSNTSGFTASNCYPIAIVTSSNTNIVTIQDMRPDIQGGGSGGGGAVRWDQITNAAAPLTLANDGFGTTFNQSSAVNWLWANTTSATSHNPTNSPILGLASTIFNGSVSTVDKWTLQNIPNPTINNGTTALKLLHTGTAGLPMFSIGDVNSLSAEASAFFSAGSLNPFGPFQTTMGYLQVFGHSQGGDTQALFVVNDYTPTNDTVFGASVWSFLTNNTGSDSTDAEIALNVQAVHQGTHSVGTVTALTIATESDGTFTTPVGTMISLEILGNLSPVGGPLATNTYSIFLHDQNQGGVAGQTNYGIFFQPQTTTGGTTTWCIFESDSTCKNQLGPTTFLGAATFKGSSSGSAAISVAAAAGTPNTLVLPLSTGAANAVLTTDGNNPQQLSWTAPSALTVLWNNIQNATGALTLNNGVNPTTFNQSSSANWTWANTTVATNVTSQSSPIWNIQGQYWTGAASAVDSWTIQDVIANGTNGRSVLTFTHAGTSGAVGINVPAGTVSVPGIWLGSTTGIQGLYSNGNNNVVVTCNGLIGNWFQKAGPPGLNLSVYANFHNGGLIGFAGPAGGASTIDTSMYRDITGGSGFIGFGNGTYQDPSGTLIFKNQLGGFGVTQLATPVAPTVVIQIGSGATTWGYKIVAKSASGGVVASAETTIANQNATLSNTAINKIAFTAIAGVSTYDVYRTTVGTSPNTTGKIGTITPSSTLNATFLYDIGSAVLSAAANASGGTTVYTGTFSNCAISTLVGCVFVISGFVNGVNNGTFTCVANTTTTITLNNAAGVAESAAATASQTGDGTTVPATNTTGAITVTTTGSATGLTLENTTAATSGVSQTSPAMAINGRYWDGAASQVDSWTIQNVQTNGTNGQSKLTLAHAGSSSGANSINVTGATNLNYPNFSIGGNQPNTLGNINSQGLSVTATGHATRINSNITSVYVGHVYSNGSTIINSTLSQFGVQYYHIIGGDFNSGAASYSGSVLFGPTSGATKFVASAVVPHINETSTATNDYTLHQLTSVEQAFLGTNALFSDYQIASPVTNAAEDAGSVVTLTVQNNKAVAGQVVLVEGMSTFTWLNGQSVTLTTASATSVTFTDPTTHGTQASAAQVGRISFSQYTINTSGVVKKYAGAATVAQGIPSSIALSDKTAQSAAVTATNLTASAPQTGRYRVSWSAAITTAATTSCVLGGTNGFQVTYTSPTDSVAKTTVPGNSTTSTTNATTTATGGAIEIYAKTGTAISYTFDYTSVGATSMVYELHVTLEAM